MTSGMTGQQQVQFPGIDVSGLPFNSMVHMYIEGTDWAGYTYQEGGTGGGPGAENSWASVVVATDEPRPVVQVACLLRDAGGSVAKNQQPTINIHANIGH